MVGGGVCTEIEMLENEIQNQENHVENVDRFIRVAKKHLHLEKLTPDVLNDMVQAVYVHAPDTSSGQRIQDVDISYNYIGILPANLLYDIINGKALLQNALICNGTALSPGGDSVKGAVLEPLSRIIGMKYAGTVLSLHIFKGVLHFATRPFHA